MTKSVQPSVRLRDPLETLPGYARLARYSRNHYHPCVDELRAANDNGDWPPQPTWTVARIESRPNGQMATYHKRKPTFSSYSKKTNRLVSGESHNERLYQVLFELDPNCIDYEMQGLTIRYQVDGDPEVHTYTADAIVARPGGIHAYEIKASGSYFLEPSYAQVMANVRDILKRAGITFQTVTGDRLRSHRRLIDNLSFGYIFSRTQVAVAEQQAIKAALEEGPRSYGQIKSSLGSDHRVQKGKAFALVAQRVIQFDLHTRLEDHTMVKLVDPYLHRDIRSIAQSVYR